MGAAYTLQPALSLLSHWRHAPLTAGDYISVDKTKVDAQIHSGDYFVTIATKIEVLSQRPAHMQAGMADELESIANELLYLQNYYEIVQKKSTQSGKDSLATGL